MDERNANHDAKAQRFMIEMPEELYWRLCERAARDHREPKAEVLVAVERLLAEAESVA